jgi:FtsH-binding integral membrane protein
VSAAKILRLTALIFLVPALVAFGVVMTGGPQTQLTQWCSYWWVLMLVAFACFFISKAISTLADS